MRQFTRKRHSVSEWRKHRYFSDDSSERLWLVIAFISSTASCVIGYDMQRCKNVPFSCSANVDLNLTADYMMRWAIWLRWCDCIKCRKYYSAIFCLLEAAFKIHLAQKSDGARSPHFEWAWRLWFELASTTNKYNFIMKAVWKWHMQSSDR